MTLNEKNILLHSYILTVHNMPCTTKMAEGGLGWVCKTTEGLGDVSPLAGSRGGALVGGLGDEVPQLKVVTSKLYAFLIVIHTQYMKSKH